MALQCRVQVALVGGSECSLSLTPVPRSTLQGMSLCWRRGKTVLQLPVGRLLRLQGHGHRRAVAGALLGFAAWADRSCCTHAHVQSAKTCRELGTARTEKELLESPRKRAAMCYKCLNRRAVRA